MTNNEAQEQPAVRTTIVGGRPPGSGKPIGDIPRGVEVLLKKAAADPEFRKLLLQNPEEAAKSIDLKLDEAESLMLQAASKEQLAQIIDQTEVPNELRRSLLKASTAAAVLAILGAAGYWFFSNRGQSKGINPDIPLPPASTGSRPDDPTLNEVPEAPNESND